MTNLRIIELHKEFKFALCIRKMLCFIVPHSSINCLQNGTKVALNTITTIDG